MKTQTVVYSLTLGAGVVDSSILEAGVDSSMLGLAGVVDMIVLAGAVVEITMLIIAPAQQLTFSSHKHHTYSWSDHTLDTMLDLQLMDSRLKLW